MKNLIVITFFAIPFALLIQGCADATQQAEMMKKEMEKITSTVDEKLELLTDSLNNVCTAKVDSIALMRISEAAKRGTGGSKNTNATTTTSTGTPKTSTSSTPKETAQQNKKDKMSGKSKTVTESDTKSKQDKMQGKQQEVTKDETDKKKSKMKGGGN